MRSNLGPDIDLATRLFTALRDATFDGVGITREAYGPGRAERARPGACGSRGAGAGDRQRCGRQPVHDPARPRPRGAKRIVLGSHLDSVRQGGNYDGAAGVLAGLATVGGHAARRVHASHATSPCWRCAQRKPAAWFPTSYPGSHAALGRLPPEMLSVRRMDSGRTLEEHMREPGLRPGRGAGRQADAGAAQHRGIPGTAYRTGTGAGCAGDPGGDRHRHSRFPPAAGGAGGGRVQPLRCNAPALSARRGDRIGRTGAPLGRTLGRAGNTGP